MDLRRVWSVLAALTFLTAEDAVVARADDVPRYKLVRHDEDYAYLVDSSRRSDWSDPIKHIRLGHNERWFLTLGGEISERFEFFDNWNWNPAAAPDGYWLQRYMFLADFHLGSRVRVFSQLKSGIENGRNRGPRPTDEDHLDVHEAFVDLSLGSGRGSALRLGRQELAYGSSRLVSVRAGPNVRQSFDGARVIVHPGAWRLDVFAAKPVITDPGIFDDKADHARTFWGVYAVGPLKLFDRASIDLYYLGLDRKLARFDQGTAPELRESIGTRIWRRAAPWDYNFELVYQWGQFGAAPIRAWTVASDTGFRARGLPSTPRFGLKADITSGDRNPAEPTLQSFNPLFPRGAYFSEMQLTGPVNHRDLHPSVDLHPLRTMTVTPSWLFLWRQSLSDGLYGVPGNLIRSGKGTTARYVGSQVAVMVSATIGRHTTLSADYEYFIAGPFLRESGPAHDVTFFATWVGFVF